MGWLLGLLGLLGTQTPNNTNTHDRLATPPHSSRRGGLSPKGSVLSLTLGEEAVAERSGAGRRWGPKSSFS